MNGLSISYSKIAKASHPVTLNTTLLLFQCYCLICYIILKTDFDDAELQSYMHYCTASIICSRMLASVVY